MPKASMWSRTPKGIKHGLVATGFTMGAAVLFGEAIGNVSNDVSHCGRRSFGHSRDRFARDASGDKAMSSVPVRVKSKHVDDFIDDPSSDPYAASWFESFRRPAIDKMRQPDERKLFATYQGIRYRVTGCSRLGDVWLHSNVNEDTRYQHRVNVDACSDWGPVQ